MKFRITLIFYFLFLQLHAEDVRVGIFSNINSIGYFFKAGGAEYGLFAGAQKIGVVKAAEAVSFVLYNGLIVVRDKKDSLGSFAKVRLVATTRAGFFFLKALNPETGLTEFGDALELMAVNGKIKAVNVIDMEKYVSTVVESETGFSAGEEFFKVQAVICRTYVMGHQMRHVSEGFEVCDQVHCQVYHYKNHLNAAIAKAVEETKRLVIVDGENRLITSAFHSNCGGCTADAGDVWTRAVSYLKPVRDTFCVHALHAVWREKIGVADWKVYLRAQNFVVTDSLLTDSSFSFFQTERMKEYVFENQKLLMKKIRGDWKFKSSWFNIAVEGDSLLFEGKGYGHGVGVCQEGAMRMAGAGWRMEEILHFYYKNVSIVNYRAIRGSSSK